MTHRRPVVLNDIKQLAQLALADTIIAPPRRGAIAAIGDPADYTGEFYIATDEKNTYLSDGADWLLVGVGVPSFDFGVQNANEILSGPVSGSPADPAFRAIDPLDLMSALAAALVAGTNVTITDNMDGTFTIDASGGGGGSPPFADNTALVKNNSDATKTAKMLCSGQSTGVDMTFDWGAQTADWSVVVPVLAANSTFVMLELAQTFTATQTVSKAQGSTFTAAVWQNTTSSQNVQTVLDGGTGASALLQFRINGVDKIQFYAGAYGFGIYDNANTYAPMQYNAAAVGSADVTFGCKIKLDRGLYAKEGSNQSSGVATLIGGTVVVSTTRVTANSRIQLTGQNLGTITVPVGYCVSARTPGTDFTILSANALDTSDVAWFIVEGY